MSKIKPQDNSSNMPIKNKGTPGVNTQHQKAVDNRSRQISNNKHRGK
jgi:hypothetical protein